MHRSFKVTLPADSNYHNLYSLLVGSVSATNVHGYGLAQGGTDETGITGAIPTDGNLPSLCQLMEICADSGNGAAITIGDRNNANTTGKVLNATDTMLRSSNRNTVGLKDYLLSGSGLAFELELEFT